MAQPQDQPTTGDEIFARSFKSARETRGFSQSDVTDFMVSKGFDWNQTTVSKIERGQRRVTVGEASALAQMVGRTVDYLASADRDSIEYKWSVVMSNAKFATVAAGEAMDQLQMLDEALFDLRSSIDELDRANEEDRGTMYVQGEATKSVRTVADFYAPLLRLKPPVMALLDTLRSFATEGSALDMLGQLNISPKKFEQRAIEDGDGVR